MGLFRKSGVKSRIQALRQMNEASGADGGGVNYEGQSAYDVADMLKQYFRDLPEPLLTNKLSETFLQIYQCKREPTASSAGRPACTLISAHVRADGLGPAIALNQVQISVGLIFLICALARAQYTANKYKCRLAVHLVFLVVFIYL